jgi:hypothetical protein
MQHEKMKSIKVMYAYHLFSQGQFEKALDYLFELEMDPLQVIGLYPGLLPKAVKSKFSYPIDIPELGTHIFFRDMC